MWYCKHDGNKQIVKVRTANGHWQARYLCLECMELTGTALDQKTHPLETLREFKTGYENPPCAVNGCGKTETALHHFMPQSIGRAMNIDADKWPHCYLCKEHHIEWHTLVTPGLLKKGWKG